MLYFHFGVSFFPPVYPCAVLRVDGMYLFIEVEDVCVQRIDDKFSSVHLIGSFIVGIQMSEDAFVPGVQGCVA